MSEAVVDVERSDAEVGFSGTQTAKIVGITYRQLDYWARTDLLRPSLAEATGSGSRRRYSYRDLLELRVIKTLLDAGIRLESVREVFTYLRKHVTTDIASAHIVISGTQVVLCDGDELVDVLRKGQGVLNVLPLAGVKDDIDTQLLPLGRGPAGRRRTTPGDMTLEHSPLDDVHRALGARLVPFGGWDMPLEYPGGTIAEHLACRSDAVVFDVSHLGTVRVTGDGAFDALQRALTNDLGKIAPGRAQYTHLLDDADASVLDDIIVWWHDDDVFDVMPNASNTDRVRAAVGGDETTHDRAVLAVQGPRALELLAGVFPEAAAVGRFRVASADWNGTPCDVAGTGYTGERGVEIAVPADAATGLWQAIVDAGIRPAGLGARDTLRLEAGLPLHGNELGPGITSLQAGLGWVVAWDKPEFAGRAAAIAEREAGVARRLVGIATEGRRPPRAGCAVLVGEEKIGAVTSGNFSPVLGHGIALAFVPPGVTEGISGGRRRPRHRPPRHRRGDAVRQPVTFSARWPLPSS